MYNKIYNRQEQLKTNFLEAKHRTSSTGKLFLKCKFLF